MGMKITVKCVGCGRKKEVGEDQREQPFCENCGSPMIVQKAEIKGEK